MVILLFLQPENSLNGHFVVTNAAQFRGLRIFRDLSQLIKYELLILRILFKLHVFKHFFFHVEEMEKISRTQRLNHGMLYYNYCPLCRKHYRLAGIVFSIDKHEVLRVLSHKFYVPYEISFPDLRLFTTSVFAYPLHAKKYKV